MSLLGSSILASVCILRKSCCSSSRCTHQTWILENNLSKWDSIFPKLHIPSVQSNHQWFCESWSIYSPEENIKLWKLVLLKHLLSPWQVLFNFCSPNDALHHFSWHLFNGILKVPRHKMKIHLQLTPDLLISVICHSITKGTRLKHGN